MNKKKNITAILVLLIAAGCSSRPWDAASVPPMDRKRKVSEQDCTKPLDFTRGNIRCK